MPFTRTAAPVVLAANQSEWTSRYRQSLAENPQHRFQWPVRDKQHLNVLLRPDLEAMTGGRCGYCDAEDLGAHSRSTIDHFRPKATFPELAFDWPNLFPSCDACQAHKLESFDDLLLKPDEPGFAFERYFTFDHATGDVLPNARASEAEQARARVSIRVFGLNVAPRPRARKAMVEKFRHARHGVPLDAWAYRFALRDVI